MKSGGFEGSVPFNLEKAVENTDEEAMTLEVRAGVHTFSQWNMRLPRETLDYIYKEESSGFVCEPQRCPVAPLPNTSYDWRIG